MVDVRRGWYKLLLTDRRLTKFCVWSMVFFFLYIAKSTIWGGTDVNYFIPQSSAFVIYTQFLNWINFPIDKWQLKLVYKKIEGLNASIISSLLYNKFNWAICVAPSTFWLSLIFIFILRGGYNKVADDVPIVFRVKHNSDNVFWS